MGKLTLYASDVSEMWNFNYFPHFYTWKGITFHTLKLRK